MLCQIKCASWDIAHVKDRRKPIVRILSECKKEGGPPHIEAPSHLKIVELAAESGPDVSVYTRSRAGRSAFGADRERS